MENEIDIQAILELTMQAGKKIQKISEIFPPENEIFLKNLAAAVIHLAMFTRDCHEMITNKKSTFDKKLENRFLDECGCNAHKGKLND